MPSPPEGNLVPRKPLIHSPHITINDLDPSQSRAHLSMDKGPRGWLTDGRSILLNPKNKSRRVIGALDD
jgi:hypothetical protein